MEPVTSLSVKRPRLMISAFKCNVCYGFASFPILSCSEGHFTCNTCLDRIKQLVNVVGICGMCQKPVDVRCRMMENVARSLEIGCEFKCGESLTLDQIANHASQCDLRYHSMIFIGSHLNRPLN